MRKKNVGAARRPTTLHQRASSTKKYPKWPIETKMIAAVFSQSLSSTGGDALFERVASSTLRGSPLSFLSGVTVLRAREPDRVCESYWCARIRQGVSVPAGVQPSPWRLDSEEAFGRRVDRASLICLSGFCHRE